MACHGRCVNLPMRAVTGRRFSGPHDGLPRGARRVRRHHVPRRRPRRRGLGARLRARPARRPAERRVRPPPARRTGRAITFPSSSARRAAQSRSPVALLLPTLSYLAYANEHGSWLNPIPATPGVDGDARARRRDRPLRRRPPAALDLRAPHRRQRGGLLVAPAADRQHAARLRHAAAAPARTSSAPTSSSWPGSTHGASTYDVITDEDLHAEGLELLAPYRVLLTGSHPEY